ncbi:MAG: glycosyltransferase [Bacteroidia bacterium]
MRILIIHNYYQQRGGEDTVVATESALLRARGHEVELLTFHNDSIAGWKKALYLFKSIYNPAAARQVRARIGAFRPDVVHVHNFFYVASPAIFYAARQAGVPVVMTLHNYRLICPSAFLYHEGQVYEESIDKIFPLQAIRKRVWNGSLIQTASIVAITGIHKLLGTFRTKVDRYIVFTEFARQLFLRSSLGVGEEKLYIKPNFVEDQGAADAPREDYYLFIGRLSPEKGIATLLDAVRRLKVPVVVLGDGPMRAEVEACAAQYPHLRYLGPRPRTEVLEHMRRCRALIFPSLWYEGMPMVIVEALSTGCPVLLSRLGNPMHMIEDGTVGLHFAPGDAADLQRCVERIEADPALRARMGQAARTSYEQHYSPDANYDLLMQLYRSLAAGAGVPQPSLATNSQAKT